jgi:hypothetical protein
VLAATTEWLAMRGGVSSSSRAHKQLPKLLPGFEGPASAAQFIHFPLLLPPESQLWVANNALCLFAIPCLLTFVFLLESAFWEP